MASLDCTDADCVADFKLHRDTRQMYPGACAIEYESIVQVLIKAIFGWDSDKQEGKAGILGTLLAYAGAHEEQGKSPFQEHINIYLQANFKSIFDWL